MAITGTDQSAITRSATKEEQPTCHQRPASKIAARSTKIDYHTVMEERTRNLARSIFNHDARSSPPQTAGGADRARERQQPSEATAEYLLLL